MASLLLVLSACGGGAADSRSDSANADAARGQTSAAAASDFTQGAEVTGIAAKIGFKSSAATTWVEAPREVPGHLGRRER
jgi:hypothetical protein